MLKAKRLLVSALAAALVGAASTASAKIMVLGGNAPGSLWYPQAQALAAVVTKYTDIKVDVLPQGATVFFPMFMTGEADMGLVNPIDAKLASQAAWPFEGANGGKGYEMVTIMLGSPNRLSLVTRADSGINSVIQLKGKRVVANYGAFTAATLTSLSVLANAGLSRDDVQVVNVSSYTEGVRAVMEGRADAAVGSLGSGILQELEAAHGAKLLPIDPSAAAMERTRTIGPAFVPMLAKKGPPGVAQDTYVLAYDTTVVARKDLDDATVRKFIDAVWNHYQELPTITRSMTTWTPDRFASMNAVIPYHPAAVAYYKEKGVWTQELDMHQQILTIMARQKK